MHTNQPNTGMRERCHPRGGRIPLKVNASYNLHIHEQDVAPGPDNKNEDSIENVDRTLTKVFPGGPPP